MKEVLELARLRLDRDLSYRALGLEIGVSERTVYRILTNPRERVYERTLHKIRKYLDAQRERGAGRNTTAGAAR